MVMGVKLPSCTARITGKSGHNEHYHESFRDGRRLLNPYLVALMPHAKKMVNSCQCTLPKLFLHLLVPGEDQVDVNCRLPIGRASAKRLLA